MNDTPQGPNPGSTDFAALPTFPPPLARRPLALPPGLRWEITPRQARVLLDLGKLVGIVALLLWLRGAAHAAAHPAAEARPIPHIRWRPLPSTDFARVQANYPRVGLSMWRNEVESLLGPPAHEAERGQGLSVWESKVRDFDRHMDQTHEYRWLIWTDPGDWERYAAVLLIDDTVYHRLKQGF